MEVGEKAPVFTADATNGVCSIEDLLGKRNLVLHFYPKNNTPGWTNQLSQARDAYAEYQARNAEVFGVNDAKLESHRRYAEKLGLPFGLISDTDKKIATMYGFIKPDTGGIARGAVVIDTQGVIRYYVAGMPKTEALLQVLDELA